MVVEVITHDVRAKEVPSLKVRAVCGSSRRNGLLVAMGQRALGSLGGDGMSCSEVLEGGEVYRHLGMSQGPKTGMPSEGWEVRCARGVGQPWRQNNPTSCLLIKKILNAWGRGEPRSNSLFYLHPSAPWSLLNKWFPFEKAHKLSGHTDLLQDGEGAKRTAWMLIQRKIEFLILEILNHF